MHFAEWKLLYFGSDFTWICSQSSNWQWICMRSSNGLAPNRCRTGLTEITYSMNSLRWSLIAWAQISPLLYDCLTNSVDVSAVYCLLWNYVYAYGTTVCVSARITNLTMGSPFAYPGINILHPSIIYVENVHFDWFNQYLYTGEHFQSDLDIFHFDFMFVKPHDVPPLLCFNVQNEIRFGVERLLLPEGRRFKKELFYPWSLFSLHVKAKQRRHFVWFHKHKIEM